MLTFVQTHCRIWSKQKKEFVDNDPVTLSDLRPVVVTERWWSYSSAGPIQRNYDSLAFKETESEQQFERPQRTGFEWLKFVQWGKTFAAAVGLGSLLASVVYPGICIAENPLISCDGHLFGALILGVVYHPRVVAICWKGVEHD